MDGLLVSQSMVIKNWSLAMISMLTKNDLTLMGYIDGVCRHNNVPCNCNHLICTMNIHVVKSIIYNKTLYVLCKINIKHNKKKILWKNETRAMMKQCSSSNINISTWFYYHNSFLSS